MTQEDAGGGAGSDAAPRLRETVLGLPPPALRPYVERYIGYRYVGFAPGLHRGLPSASMTLIVSFAGPVDIVRMPHDAQAPSALPAFVAGLAASPALIRHEGDQQGVALDLTPLGARAVLGMPAAALASAVVDLSELWGPVAAALPERLAAAVTWHDRFALIDDALLRSVADVPGPAPEIARAWQVLVASAGALTVGAVASEVGWGRRHLGTRFREEIGITPKAAARIMRFDRARRLIPLRASRTLADVAAETGYYDQSHLTRDFHDLAGCAPSTWIAEEALSVDDALVSP